MLKVRTKELVDVDTYRVEVDVDTYTELPTKGELHGYRLAIGSIAFAVRDKSFYALDSDGNWIDQTGDES